MKDILVYYSQYNIWANQKLAFFFAGKPESLLTQTIENSFPSIHETALHILSAESSWLARLQQDEANNKRVEPDFKTTNELFQALVKISLQFSQFVKKQNENFFESEIAYQTWDGTSWVMTPKIMVHHCMNHSTYHRGQLITLARQLGLKEGIPSTDLLYYSREVI